MPDDQDVWDVAWERIGRYLAGEMPAAESEAFAHWLAEQPERAALVAELRAAVDRTAFAPPADLDVEAALAHVHERMDAADVRSIATARSRSGHRPLWRSTPLRAAAAVALLLGATVLYRSLRPGSQPAVGPVAARTFQTPIGQADTLQLADGTTVVLAPASRLLVAAGYGEGERSVRLEGVAWFDVRHDQRRPFTVAAGDALVTDLGTAFTVRADPAQPVSVAVTEGSVRLAPNSAPASGVILAAGQSGKVAGGVAAAEAAGSGDAALAWTRGRLVFADAPFPQVAAELRRWYGVQLVAGDAALAERHLTSEFEGEAVADVVAVIALALDARSETRGDTIMLHSVR